MNGDVDNATGTAALIEMARAFAHGRRPDRSVVSLAVTAEERGLLGSEYDAARPLYPLAVGKAAAEEYRRDRYHPPVDEWDPDGPPPACSATSSCSARWARTSRILRKV